MNTSMWLVRDLFFTLFSVISCIIGNVSTDPAEPVVLKECVQLSEADCPLDEYFLSFYLYTRETQDNPFKVNESNINEAPFVINTPIKVLIHGYTGWKDFSPNKELRPAYFDYGEYNIISLDWGPLANESCYIEATYNVKFVGICTAKFLDKLVEVRHDIVPEDIHIVGFSLGAHVAGNIGRSTQFKIHRITALDPALPLFDDIFNAKYSVQKSDSEFMDSVHTNAGLKGKIDAVGDVDFYMNNAVVQPGCSPSDTTCSHDHAVLYFAESIASKIGFWGYQCYSLWSYLIGTCLPPSESDWVLMGEHVSHSSRGIYFIQTNEKPPFAMGKKKTKEGEKAMLESYRYALNVINPDERDTVYQNMLPNEIVEY